MAKKDTAEAQPVSVEEEIASLIDAAEESETEIDAQSDEVVAAGDDEPEDDTAATQDAKADDDEEEAEDEPGDDLDDGEESGHDNLDPPEHWSAADKAAFNEQPPGAQEWMMKRHREIEGDYTRKRQQESAQVRMAEAVTDALSPYQQEFAAAGLDHVGAVRQLASWHVALKTSPREAIQKLAATYGIDLNDPGIEDDTDPVLKNIQQELGSIKQGLTRQSQLAQQQEHDNLNATIQNFVTATDASGNPAHPHFNELYDDMVTLFQAKKAGNLDEAYALASRMNPDIVKVSAPKAKINPAEKVKQAKRAATGIRSSGAVGKRDRGKMSLEDEIASHFS